MEMLQVQGQAVPALGYGTWPLKGKACYQGVAHALALGYRHIDTAQGYDNEAEVGRAMRDSGLPREEIFLVTKVRPQNFTFDKTLASSRESLSKLNTPYIDLLLLHWPNDRVPLSETMKAMRRLQDEGVTHHIGVSNFSPGLVKEAAQYATIFCNQVEYHPYHPQDDLIRQAREMGYLFTAYSPVARGKVMGDPVLQKIGARHGKSPAQVSLRWIIQQGLSTIPQSSSEKNRAANIDIFDFALTEEEMAEVDGLASERFSIHR
jgi:diketogulonate reductase-like aldo/keto reductase